MKNTEPQLELLCNKSFIALLIMALLAPFSFARNDLIGVEVHDEALLQKFKKFGDYGIAFIDLSDKKLGPQIVVANIEGEILRKFAVPSTRYSNDWIHWGPGITFDSNRKSIWYLAPKVGLTEFDIDGKVLHSINYEKASHQIQITSNGTFVIPYSWDTQNDYQLSEIDRDGLQLFGWHAADFLKTNTTSTSIANSQPLSYTATTSAVKTSSGNYFLSLSQNNTIIKINQSGKVLWSQTVSIRPHTLVIDGDELIGYSARDPNRIVIKNRSCQCFNSITIEENLPKNVLTRSLSLQYLGEGFWFTSGVSSLYLLDENGRIFWKINRNNLKSRTTGFHSAVVFKSF